MGMTGKTIIVTGASSGIGEAAAKLLAKAGANVVLGARRAELLDQHVQAITTHGGITGDLGPIPGMDSATWHRVMAVNLTSAFYAAKHQVPPMLARGGGSIVFTSSFVGHTIGLPGMGAYAASKAGLIGLTQVLAAEHGAAGLRANALLPGGTQTPMAGDDAGFHEVVRNLHALKRMASPDEIARAAIFLLSEASSFITGTAMLADGGNSINKF